VSSVNHYLLIIFYAVKSKKDPARTEDDQSGREFHF